jgi:hypothetical protein
MTDVASYFVTLAQEVAAALSGMMYNPVAWFDLLAFLLLGAIAGSAANPRHGVIIFALGSFVLVFAVLTLERAYRPPLTRGDNAALALLFLLGTVAGQWVGRRLSRRRA